MTTNMKKEKCPESDCFKVHYRMCKIHGDGTHKHDFYQFCEWKPILAPPESAAWEAEFDKDVETFLRNLPWSDDATDELKTVTIGNVRNFAGHVKSVVAKKIRQEERDKFYSFLYDRAHQIAPMKSLSELLSEYMNQSN